MNLNDIGFDFEEMARLANEDPDGFARRREELIQRLTAKSSQSEQLADLQMDLDADRYCSSPGLQSGEKMVSMMLKSTVWMTKHLAMLNDLIENKASKMKT